MRTATNLASVFFFIVPLISFRKVATWTDKYAYKDWVIEKHGNDRDGNKKKVGHFEEAPQLVTKLRRKQKHRHRDNKEKQKFVISTGFVLCWFASLILQGALFGKSKPRANDLYAKEGYGINVPIIRNAMVRDTYKFMRRYIHFCDNDLKKKPGEEG